MAIRTVDQNADLIGTVASTFNISGSNDKLQVTIDGGSAQNITLTHGATQSAASVVADINAVLTGGTAYVYRSSYVRIRTSSANGATSTILIGAPSNNANATLGFTAGTMTGYSRTNTNFTGGTKQNIIDNLVTILQSVGWTVISGGVGTSNTLMQSCATPPGEDLQIRVRIKDNAGNCVQLSIENITGTKVGTNNTTNGGHLLPATGKVFKVIANKYLFLCTTLVPVSAREFVMAGTGFLPQWLQGLTTDAGFLQANATSDTDTNARNCFRVSLGATQISSTPFGAWEISLYNSALWEGGGDLGVGTQCLQGLNGANMRNGVCGYQWSDGSPVEYDAVIAWGNTLATDVATLKVQLPDCFVVSDSIAGDTSVTTTDGKNAYAITNSNAGTTGQVNRGTLFIIIP